MSPTIPDVVIQRLPHYLRALRALHDEGTEVVSSQELGRRLRVTPAQIRKDLSYFGRFGKQGRGYNVYRLLDDLAEILGLDRSWPVILVGVGRLGRAIVTYPGFTPEGFHIKAIFDADPGLVGKRIASLEVRPLSEIEPIMRQEEIAIGIVAVPGEHAQGVIDLLVGSGIKAILNYAPISPSVPDHVHLRTIDPVQALQTMTFHLHEHERATTRTRQITRVLMEPHTPRLSRPA